MCTFFFRLGRSLASRLLGVPFPGFLSRLPFQTLDASFFLKNHQSHSAYPDYGEISSFGSAAGSINRFRLPSWVNVNSCTGSGSPGSPASSLIIAVAVSHSQTTNGKPALLPGRCHLAPPMEDCQDDGLDSDSVLRLDLELFRGPGSPAEDEFKIAGYVRPQLHAALPPPPHLSPCTTSLITLSVPTNRKCSSLVTSLDDLST